MSNPWYCKRVGPPRITRSRPGRFPATSCFFFGLAMVCVGVFAGAKPCFAGDAPAWLHALATVPLPSYPPKTAAVQLLFEETVIVKDNGETKTVVRLAYKILRPEGTSRGNVQIDFDRETPISNLRGWSIPAQGKDYEVKQKDGYERGVFNDDLFSDVKVKVIQIPASDPGNIIGYEYERKGRPYLYKHTWWFQDPEPVLQARFTLQLPAGWEYKAQWVNHPGVQPTTVGANQWQWQVSNVAAVTEEPDMPPWRAIAGRMEVAYFPNDPAGRQKALGSWRDLAAWYKGLVAGRRDPSPDIKQKVAALTGSAPTQLEKMKALAEFAQREIRYVAVEVGIGGYQPHPAAEVYSHRYGDCKDKATLLSTMLKEIGVDSYYVIINSRRGVARPDQPPSLGAFDHAILAIKLPEGVAADSLLAVRQDEKTGKLLFFDPTDSLTPFGQLSSYLQANYGLLVMNEGGELVKLPLLPPGANLLERTAKLTLNTQGILSGDVREIRLGDKASERRAQWMSIEATKRAQVLESFLSHSLGGFALQKASVGNLERSDQPLVIQYSFLAENYARRAGELLLVRPRVLGSKASGELEGEERKYPVEFPAASLETDNFEIQLPPGYEADELPPPVDVDYGFAAYHSKTQVAGQTLKYTRTFLVKDVLVPVKQIEDLKRLYRYIAGDERSTAVLRPARAAGN